MVWNAPDIDVAVEVQSRYRMTPVPGRARVLDDRLILELAEPIFGVAPGQAVVCYEGDVVLGGGTIEHTGAEAAK